MNKELVVISSPFDTISGYGARSRDIIRELIKSEKYNIRLLPQRWGNTPWGFCKNNPEWSYLYDYVLKPEEHQIKPNIFIQITIPNEFNPVGYYNIGITAGIENDICPPDWMEGLNRMDLNIVSSEHSKNVFQNTKYNKKINGNVEELILNKPIKVLFEGVDTSTYNIVEEGLDVINDIPEDFCFLTLGHWLQGDLGEDRKNIGLTVKLFYEAFKNIKNQPALILKTSFGNSSKMSKHEVFKKIHEIKKLFKKEDQLPNIYLLNSDLKDSEINKLYNHPKIKSLISLTKGEGFGRPLLEFSFVGKPIISTYWSGQVDFLKKDNILPLKGELKHVHPSSQNQWLIKEGKWFNVNEDETKNAFRIMFNNYKKYLSKADSQKKYVEENFTTDKMGEKLLDILNENYKPQPQFKPLVLPNIL